MGTDFLSYFAKETGVLFVKIDYKLANVCKFWRQIIQMNSPAKPRRLSRFPVSHHRCLKESGYLSGRSILAAAPD